MRGFGQEISGNRGKNAELSIEQRSAIIYTVENGISATKIATDFGITRNTVYTTIKRFKQH